MERKTFQLRPDFLWKSLAWQKRRRDFLGWKGFTFSSHTLEGRGGGILRGTSSYCTHYSPKLDSERSRQQKRIPKILSPPLPNTFVQGQTVREVHPVVGAIFSPDQISIPSLQRRDFPPLCYSTWEMRGNSSFSPSSSAPFAFLLRSRFVCIRGRGKRKAEKKKEEGSISLQRPVHTVSCSPRSFIPSNLLSYFFVFPCQGRTQILR